MRVVTNPHLYAVILAGGSGTRFWPLSRERFPKQLLQIIGDDTLIQQTVRRVLRVVPANRMCIVTNQFQADSIQLQLVEWKEELKDGFILEPEGRNTAPAIGIAALRLVRRDPDALMLVMPADHVIRGDVKFKAAISVGCRLAQDGYLVTFGIRPTRPETGYGYIHPDLRARLGKRGGLCGYKVARFVEKPNLAKARVYLRKGNYYWNSGIFLWRASTILEEFAKHQPALLRGLKALNSMDQSGDAARQFATQYKKLKSVSIDYGVMERSSQSAVVPVDFSWSDIGSWGSLDEVVPRDKKGNVKTGNVVDLESRDSIVFADRRLVASIGLTGMVVVDTPDATLVCPKSRSQDVKKLVEILKRRGAPEHLEHVTVFRPWGSYTVLEQGPGYKVKRITVLPGGRLSLQLHHRRSEHWVVIAGTARVTRGSEVFDLHPGESTGIPKETQHRLENPGEEVLEIIEVQNGPYLGEDDIVRYHDDYGREQKHPAS